MKGKEKKKRKTLSSFWFMQLKFEPPNLQVPLKDSSAAKITEKIEVASTKQVILVNSWNYWHF